MGKTVFLKAARRFVVLLVLVYFSGSSVFCQEADQSKGQLQQKIFYGNASFYANFFHGRVTANGELFNQDKFTAACNVLPLGTWIKITNLRNGRTAIVKTTDRLHRRMLRLVDVSRAVAKKLGYINSGLTRVKVEVLNQATHKKISLRESNITRIDTSG